MHDFDIERAERQKADRSFKIAGETFARRASVRPEALEEWEDYTPIGRSQAEALAVIDRTIKALIEPGAKGEAHKRWDNLRKRDDDPVTLADMIGLRDEEGVLLRDGLIQWLTAEMAGRPTGPSVSSSGGPGASETSSTEGSSSPGLRAVSGA